MPLPSNSTGGQARLSCLKSSYIPCPVLAHDIKKREKVQVVLEEFYLLLVLCLMFCSGLTEYFELISVENLYGISFSLRRSQANFSNCSGPNLCARLRTSTALGGAFFFMSSTSRS